MDGHWLHITSERTREECANLRWDKLRFDYQSQTGMELRSVLVKCDQGICVPLSGRARRVRGRHCVPSDVCPKQPRSLVGVRDGARGWKADHKERR